MSVSVRLSLSLLFLGLPPMLCLLLCLFLRHARSSLVGRPRSTTEHGSVHFWMAVFFSHRGLWSSRPVRETPCLGLDAAEHPCFRLPWVSHDQGAQILSLVRSFRGLSGEASPTPVFSRACMTIAYAKSQTVHAQARLDEPPMPADTSSSRHSVAHRAGRSKCRVALRNERRVSVAAPGSLRLGRQLYNLPSLRRSCLTPRVLSSVDGLVKMDVGSSSQGKLVYRLRF